MPNPERNLISAVLRTRDYDSIAGAELDPEYFASHREEWIWLSEYLHKHRRVPSRVAFIEAFPEFAVIKTDDVAHFADQVRQSYARRSLTRSMRSTAEHLNKGELDTALRTIQQSLISTAETLGTVSDGDILRDGSAVMETVTAYHDRIVDTGSAGYPTGFDTWDDITGGVKPGELCIVAARMGTGKTWQMVKMATTALLSGHTVLFDSLEMSRAQVALRAQTLLSRAVGRSFAAADMLSGNTPPDLNKYREISVHLSKHIPGRLHVADTAKGRISPLTIASQIKRIKPDVVFVDYLTLLEKQGDGDWRSVAALSNELKAIAQRHDVAIVAAAQLNRMSGVVKRGFPGLESLAQSDSIGQDADQICLIQQRSRRAQQMKLAKNRHGVGGHVWWVEFRPGEGIIEETSGDRGYELVSEDDVNDAQRGS